MTAESGWTLEEVGGLVLLRCAALARLPGIAHAFSTRRGEGGSDFDLGGAELGPDPAAATRTAGRRERLLAAAGFAGERLIFLRQVHGNRIVGTGPGSASVEADGVFWVAGDPAPGIPSVRTADCVPLLLAAEDGRALAAVHAGWRGTAARIALLAVEALERAGVAPAELTAALGPSIRPCCYPVSPAVAAAVAGAVPGARPSGEQPGLPPGERPVALDLQDANRRQLIAAGVPEHRIHVAGICTACRPDLFFSYRRDGGGCGRMMAVIGAGSP